MLLIFSNPANPHFSGDELDPVADEREQGLALMRRQAQRLGH
jgi:hypothetical protein